MVIEPTFRKVDIEERIHSTARLFKAMAHPTRLRLICGLHRQPTTQAKISKICNIPQSSLAQHLAVLKREGIIRGRREHGAEVILEVSDVRVRRVFREVCEDVSFLDLTWEELCGDGKEGPSVNK